MSSFHRVIGVPVSIQACDAPEATPPEPMTAFVLFALLLFKAWLSSTIRIPPDSQSRNSADRFAAIA